MDLLKINKVSLKAKKLEIGDKIPVGGNTFTGEVFLLEIDKIPNELADAFGAIKLFAEKQIHNLHNAEILAKQKILMSQFLFTHLFVFAQHISKMFPDLKDTGARGDLYNNQKTVTLSELFKKKAFQCAEYAVIAQLYLQSIGIDSEYVGGEFIISPTQEFGDQHSFIIIHENDKDYVFDPANEIKLSSVLPNISIIDITPQQKIKIQGMITGKGRRVAFFATNNLITKKKIYYGYGDGCNVLPEMVLENQPEFPENPTIIKDGNER